MKLETRGWLARSARLLVVAGALVASGCGVAEGKEGEALSTAEALGDTPESAELRQWMELASAERPAWGPEAAGCDQEPEVTWTEVCGQRFPTAVRLAWSGCRPQPRRGPPGMEPGGQRPPPPPGGMGTGGRPPPPPGGVGGDRLPPPEGMGPGQGAPPVLSSGTVDESTTVEPLGECGEGVALRLRRQATFDTRSTDAEGRTLAVSGSSSSVSTHTPGAQQGTRTMTLDTTRSLADAQGTVLHGMRLQGTLEVVEERSGQAPTHTSRGTLQVQPAGGSVETVVVGDLVRVPPHVCPWPLSGSIQRTTAEGAARVLTFGPECGQATLDGRPVQLPQPRRGPGGRR